MTSSTSSRPKTPALIITVAALLVALHSLRPGTPSSSSDTAPKRSAAAQAPPSRPSLPESSDVHAASLPADKRHRPAPVSRERAKVLGVNTLRHSEDGWPELKHPLHRAVFRADELVFENRRAQLQWKWRLAAVRFAAEARALFAPAHALPAIDRDTRTVNRDHGPVIERYLPGLHVIEQRFIIPRRLHGEGDLLIEGAVECSGELEELLPRGWQWRDERGVVSLGNVHVFDAEGTTIAAGMEVTADATRIRVDGPALAAAVYPVTVDPEIGTNDFRLSTMGTINDPDYDGTDPDAAWDSARNQFLVVWCGQVTEDGEDVTDDEIFGRFVDGATGTLLGEQIRISDLGPPDDNGFTQREPAVAFNSTDDEFLVVWNGEDDTAPLVRNEREIFARRIDAVTRMPIASEFLVSDAGDYGDDDLDAGHPAIAYNPTNNEYLVVWEADDTDAGLADGETEIFGQRLTGAGATATGTNDFQISFMGANGNSVFRSVEPDVAYCVDVNEYYVVWSGRDDNINLSPNETEIYGQRVDAIDGSLEGTRLRVSQMGADGDPLAEARQPAVAYDALEENYCVVWGGGVPVPPGSFREYEIYGQLVTKTGTSTGPDDFQVSTTGPAGDTAYRAEEPDVAADSDMHDFWVVWERRIPLVSGGDHNDQEIFAQRVSGEFGTLVGSPLQVSDMGDGDALYDAEEPAIAFSASSHQFLAVWSGDDSRPEFGDQGFEITGQFIDRDTTSEVGPDDFQVSTMGPDVSAYEAFDPAVAFNTTNEEFLVVWSGQDNEAGLGPDEKQIFGQRIDALTGAELGPDDFLVSQMNLGSDRYNAREPDVTYNSLDNQFLVVWAGDKRFDSQLEEEIFGQLLDNLGSEIGADDFRISDMGPASDSRFEAWHPSVAYNLLNNQYMVVWCGDDDTGGMVNDEFEIFGQRLGATGTEIGTNDFRISETGPDGTIAYLAFSPQVIHNVGVNQFVVVWSAGPDPAYPVGMVSGELEIHGRRYDGGTGLDLFGGQKRLTHAGPDGSELYVAVSPAIACNPNLQEYLLVWWGNHDAGTATVDDHEIWGLGLDLQLDPVTGGGVFNTGIFRISDAGPDGDAGYRAYSPDVSYDTSSNEYLVVWLGDDDVGGLVDNELEIFGQRIDGNTLAEIGPNDFRISDLGPDGDPGYDAARPVVACDPASGIHVVLWAGNDGLPGSDAGGEIYGQLLGPAPFRITELVKSGDHVIVRFLTDNNQFYRLQFSPDLAPGSWSFIPGNGGLILGTGGTDQITHLNGAAGHSHRFYRVIRSFERP